MRRGSDVPPLLPRGRKSQNHMGATRTQSQKVIFDYFLTDSEGNEFCLGVTATVNFGSGIEYAQQGFAIGAATDDEVSVETCGWTDEKGVAGDNVDFLALPEAMRAAIEQKAIEEACEKACF